MMAEIVEHQEGHEFHLEEDAESVGMPRGWIQWKGTDVCMDIHCGCGAIDHVDGDFAYFVQCEYCGRIYEVSSSVKLHFVRQEKTPDMELKEKLSNS